MQINIDGYIDIKPYDIKSETIKVVDTKISYIETLLNTASDSTNVEEMVKNYSCGCGHNYFIIYY